MPTRSTVTVFIDRTEAVHLHHYPETPSKHGGSLVPESWCLAYDRTDLFVKGTPAEVAAWFRQVADQIDAIAAAEVIAAQHDELYGVAV